MMDKETIKDYFDFKDTLVNRFGITNKTMLFLSETIIPEIRLIISKNLKSQTNITFEIVDALMKYAEDKTLKALLMMFASKAINEYMQDDLYTLVENIKEKLKEGKVGVIVEECECNCDDCKEMKEEEQKSRRVQ